jgi:hypothetical protein
MTRWDLASRLSDALESALPRGCTVTLEVPGRAHPQGPKDSHEVRARILYQDAAGRWQKTSVGVPIGPELDLATTLRDLAAWAAKHVLKSRTRGAA